MSQYWKIIILVALEDNYPCTFGDHCPCSFGRSANSSVSGLKGNISTAARTPQHLPEESLSTKERRQSG